MSAAMTATCASATVTTRRAMGRRSCGPSVGSSPRGSSAAARIRLRTRVSTASQTVRPVRAVRGRPRLAPRTRRGARTGRWTRRGAPAHSQGQRGTPGVHWFAGRPEEPDLRRPRTLSIPVHSRVRAVAHLSLSAASSVAGAVVLAEVGDGRRVTVQTGSGYQSAGDAAVKREPSVEEVEQSALVEQTCGRGVCPKPRLLVLT